MPKVFMEFNLPEESEECEAAQNGREYALVLWEVDQYLRSQIKHGQHPEAIENALQAVRDKLHEEVQSHNLSIS